MHKRLVTILLLGIFLLSGCGKKEFNETDGIKMPYYFITIVNDAHHGDKDASVKIKEEYEQLKKMIAQADEYKIKLTLLFPPQWVDVVSLEDVEAWEKAGHEIGAYHQSIFHDNWDGYTNFSDELAIKERQSRVQSSEKILGDIGNFIEELDNLKADIKTACMGAEVSKASLAEDLVYGTCSGFANFGEPGRVIKDNQTPNKGINEYISVGKYGGKERKWLAHYQMTDIKREKMAEETFYKLIKGVFGVYTKSSVIGSEAYFAWIDFLYQRDREVKKSKTVTEIIRGNLIPQKQLP